jgi:signal transduction histidine kinase
MKDLLLDIITHDVKNPAGTILGAVGLLKKNELDEELLEIIQKSCENLLNIISHATTLSKVAMDEMLNTEELNLHNMVEEIAGGFMSSLSYYNMTLDNKIPSDQLIRANPIIEEVFTNYISNAIKYASSGEKIIIECKENGKYLDIYVKDFGETIPIDKREAVFIRNFQLAETKGRGLGLSIVKKIAEAHHGSAWVEANTPKGNCFAIRIPLY